MKVECGLVIEPCHPNPNPSQIESWYTCMLVLASDMKQYHAIGCLVGLCEASRLLLYASKVIVPSKEGVFDRWTSISSEVLISSPYLLPISLEDRYDMSAGHEDHITATSPDHNDQPQTSPQLPGPPS